MELIESEMAEVVLWNMAEYLPRVLELRYKENPMELLETVERKIRSAQSWSATTLMNGGNPDEVKEIALTLLMPNHQPENPEQPDEPITEELVAKIWQDLIDLRKSKK